MTTQECYEAGLTRNLFTSKEDALAKRENIAKWVTDLETTTDLQTTGFLHRLTPSNHAPAGFCCLGRACVVLGVKATHYSATCEAFDGETAQLSLELAANLALGGAGGYWAGPPIEGIDTLWELNDNENWSFKQIAAFIRGSFKGCTGEDL